MIVPTGELHALPWSMLPSLAHRPLTVAPSLRLWHRAVRRAPAPNAAMVLAAGPRLPAATEEIETLRARHPEAVALTGDGATVAAVASALDGADSAHLAAHGRFRDDNPLFCSLELADGALTVYDLERLRRTPRRLVLSSCESGLSTVHAGDELMGFTAAVFALGTADRRRGRRARPRRSDRGAHARARRRAQARHGAGPSPGASARGDRRRRPPPRRRPRGVRLFRRRLTTLDSVKTKSLRSTIELVLIVAAALFFALTLQALAVKPYRIPSGSMLPTLKPGQRIIVDRFSHRIGADPKLGDVTVFFPPEGADSARCGHPNEGPFYSGGPETRHPCSLPTGTRSQTTFVKRVVGLPGDTIAVDHGHVIRNGKPVSEPFASSCSGAECNLNPITIPAKHYFLMGDNRGNSDDSRFWGPVPREWIIGKAVVSYWPPKDVGGL